MIFHKHILATAISLTLGTTAFAAGQQQTQDTGGTAESGTSMPKSDVDVDRMGRDESSPGMQQSGSEPGMASMSTTAEELKGMEVQTRDNEEIGKVEKIVSDAQTDQLYAIISVGGVLGMGDKKVPVQLDQLQLQDDQLIVHGVSTRDELENRPEYVAENYRDLEDERQIDRAEFSAFEGSEPGQIEPGQSDIEPGQSDPGLGDPGQSERMQ
jgi:sporulation protein YlmC with PRC-barrel domain